MTLLATLASAQTDEWVLGGQGGLSWDASGHRRFQIDDQSEPGSIQIWGVEPGRNIIGQLDWDCGFPAAPRGERQACIASPTDFSGRIQVESAVDGDPQTAIQVEDRALGTIINLDLGAQFPADSLVFYPRQEAPFEDDFPLAFEIFVNDGVQLTNGVPIYEPVVLQTENRESIASVSFPGRGVRFVRFRSLTRSYSKSNIYH